MAKQSILGRISQLVRANINALIDQAEDPQLMLDQLVRDYTNSIAEAESAVAQTVRIGDERIAFAAGEMIRTEESYKYTPDSFARIAAEGDFDVAGTWFDGERRFSLQAMEAAYRRLYDRQLAASRRAGQDR